LTAGGKGLRSGTIGLTGSVVIAVSSVAPAYSLAAVLAGIGAVVGAKTPALFVIGFLPMLLTAFAFRELAGQTPDCGSTFTWATRAFGPWVGWLAGWAAFIAATVAVGNGAQIAAIYLLKALHLNALADSMAAQVAVGALAVVVLALLCVRGINVTERTQAVLVVVQFGMLALVSVVALVKVFSHHAGPQAVIPQWSWLPGLLDGADDPAGYRAAVEAAGLRGDLLAVYGAAVNLRGHHRDRAGPASSTVISVPALRVLPRKKSRPPPMAVSAATGMPSTSRPIPMTNGAPKHPQWYYNLKAHRECQFGDERFVAAEVTDPDEHARPYGLAEQVYAGYGDYRVKTAAVGRQIPVFRLKPR
jgi:hypothetical protein